MYEIKYKILFGNSYENIGKRLAKTFRYFGFETSFCSNIFRELEKELNTSHYDGLIFFCYTLTDRTIEFIQGCKADHPDIRIYPMIATESQEVKNKLINAGATSCITMPNTEFSVCGDVIGDFYSYDEMVILPEIAEFLREKGFPDHLAGFYFLCCAVEIAVSSPELLQRINYDLYPKVAEKMNTSYDNVERSIRVLCNQINIEEYIEKEPPGSKLTSKNIIKLVTSEYAGSIGH